MKYLISVHNKVTESDAYGAYGSEAEMKQALADTDRFNQRLQQEGYWVFAGGLQPASSAVVVDGRGGQPTVTDGPCLKSDEHLEGFWIIEAPDSRTAIELASDASRACRDRVEVRPFHSL